MDDCPYTDAFLAERRAQLEAERLRVQAEIAADTQDFLDWAGPEAEEQDQHPADAATALTEQEVDLSLVQNSRYVLREIEDSLARLDDGRYGWDEEGGLWIREERLEALPWARREIEGQRRVESESARNERDRYSHDTDVTSL
jgi:RNA polymerase-binding transcription factor DksA